jgi:1-acyl-sn-glycerol-3-phosphate acyltransferase
VNWARALAFNIAFFAWTGLLGTVAVPVLLMSRKTVMRFGRFWARSVLCLLRTMVGLDHRIIGFDRVPGGGCIIAMKHQSAWDTLILTVAFGDPAPIVKRELLLLPFYGWYAARAGSIGVDRQGGASTVRRMLMAARKAVVEGRPVIIFPQGTRVAPGASMAYHPGVYALYRALSLPLVPAAVNSGMFHLLLLNILRPRDPRYAALPLPGVDAGLAFAVVCWPVADPLARYQAVRERVNDRLVEAHHQFWPSEDAMAEGNPQLILERGEPVEKPPALIMQGTSDDNLTPRMAKNFAAAYTRAGGMMAFHEFEGEPHAFIAREPTSANAQLALGLIADFIHQHTR